MLLSTAFCPPVEYFAVLAGYSPVFLEACESYAKQSWRNRCRILSANGPLDLTVPVVHPTGASTSPPAGGTCPRAHGQVNQDFADSQALGSGRLITGVSVEYTTPWVAKMEKAIDSAYDSSPFFEFYRDGLYAILDSSPEKLWDLNLRIIKWICERIGIAPEIRLTEDFEKSEAFKNSPPSQGGVRGGNSSGLTVPPSGFDLREAIHPKRPNTILRDLGLERPYWQVFGDKFGFVQGLSVLDLLFNEGPESICWLR